MDPNLNNSEQRRNEILTEELDIKKQLSKIETDLANKIAKRIQLEFTVRDNLNATRDIEKEILRNKQSQGVLQQQINKFDNDKTKRAADAVNKLKKQIDATNNIIKQEQLYEKLKKKINVEGALELSILKSQQEALEKEKTTLGEILGESEKLDRSLFNISGNIVSSMPGLGKFSQSFKEAALASRQAGGGFKGLTAGFASIVKSLGAVGTIVYLITKGLEADNQITQLAKGLTKTKEEALFARYELTGIAGASKDAFITTEKLVESTSRLSKELGISKIYSADVLTEFTKLTGKMGITENAAANLSKLAIIQGKNAHIVTTESLGTAQALQAQNGIQLNNKQILEEVGKVSGQLLSNFQANPKAIAESITQAKLLGTTLETTKKQSEALLNFQSSIESELRAELMTGQALNLERARGAALIGDQTLVMKELANQNINFYKYSRMNVLAQNDLANALGLSSDQLSDQLIQQQFIGKSRAQIAALAGEEVANRLEELSAQEKFNNAVKKMQDLFVSLVDGPIGLLLNGIVNTANIILQPLSLLSSGISGGISKSVSTSSSPVFSNDNVVQAINTLGDRVDKLADRPVYARPKEFAVPITQVQNTNVRYSL
jgi:hypothetical protein